MNPAFRLVASELSRLLSGTDGTRALSALQILARGDGDVSSSPPLFPNAIGIWRKDGDGRYVRSQPPRWDHSFWSDAERLEYRPDTYRLVLIGESVARGMLYDPVVTPAGMLRDVLAAAAGRPVEVYDLARVSMGAGELIQLLKSIAPLRPDGIVIFAGNNWATWPEMDEPTRWEMAAALRTGGFPALKHLWWTRVLQGTATTVVDALADAGREYGAHCTFVIPEFNLADWIDDASLVPPLLSGDGNARWLSAFDDVHLRKTPPGPDELERLGRQLNELDGGLSFWGAHLRGRAALDRGAMEDAGRFLRQARDAVCGVPLGVPPRCPEDVQEALRGRAADRGVAIVDVPALLARKNEGALPGADDFLDYCHMTFSGLSLVMSHLAASVLAQIGVDRPAESLKRHIAQPTAADHGMAELMGAIHTAHLGNAPALVRTRLRRAVATGEPMVLSLMAGVHRWSDRATPDWMWPEFRDACRHPIPRRYLALVGGPLAARTQFCDAELRTAIADALRHGGHSVDGEGAGRNGQEPRETRFDLLAPRHHRRAFWERRELNARTGFHRSFLPTVEFLFELTKAGPLTLSLTHRLPGTAVEAGAEVVLTVNGHELARLTPASAWTSAEVAVPARMTKSGDNRLAIRWPLQRYDEQAERERIAFWLERGVIQPPMPSLGELYRLECRVGQALAADASSLP